MRSSQNTKDKYSRIIHEDRENSDEAIRKINEYVDRLSINWRTEERPYQQVRDQSLAFLKEQRASEYYQGIKARIVAGDKFYPSEYYYFVLTTESLQLVDVEILERVEEYFSFENCDNNLLLVKTALHYQHARTEEEKMHWQQELADAMRFDYANNVRSLFLNLAGVDISGANLMDAPGRGSRGCPHLNFADLSGAKFDGCKMYALPINYSDLTGASLRGVYGDKYGPRFSGSIARNACFDGIQLYYGSCCRTDFTNASFKHATFEGMGLIESNFDNANFEGAVFLASRETYKSSFNNANFFNAKLKTVSFSRNDFNGARFINPACLNNLSDLNEELNRIADEFLSGLDSDNWFDKDQIQGIQNLIAKDVARCVNEKFPKLPLRYEFYDAAVQHRLFHYQLDFTTSLTRGAKSIYNSTMGTLFSEFGKYYSDNPAVKYLEEQRDQIAADVRHHPMPTM